MTVYVALLRGINVGRNKQVPMADLQRVVRSADELDAIVTANPFREAIETPSNLHVVFLDRAALAPGEVRLAGREIYVWYRKGMAGSKLGDNPWRRVGATSTDRHWNTVTKLAASPQV